jgi:hypothetical protein
LLPGNEIQNKWRNIRDNFRRELQLQKKGASGQGARKRRKYIYFDRLLFLLPTLQDRETTGNVTPPLESEPEAVTRTEMGEGSHTANVRQQKQRPKKPTYEESLLKIIEQKDVDIDEDRSFLLSLVPSFKKLNDDQKFIAKIEFLNVLRRVTFGQPPHHVSSAPQLQPSNILQYSNLPGPPTHPSYIGTLPSPHNQHINFTPSPQHSSSTNSSIPGAHMSPSAGNCLSPVSELYDLQ